MNLIINFFKSIGAYIIPYISEGLTRYVKNQIELRRQYELKKEQEKLLKEAIENEKNATTTKEQEDAFKDVIDHANGD